MVMLVSSTGLEDWISKKIKILPKIQDVLHLQRLESGVEQLETRVVAPIDTFRKMCISVYSIIDLYTYIYIYIKSTVSCCVHVWYVYIHTPSYLSFSMYIYIYIHMLFCERSCLFHFNSSFFPSLHPSIHSRAVKCNKHACMTVKY